MYLLPLNLFLLFYLNDFKVNTHEISMCTNCHIVINKYFKHLETIKNLVVNENVSGRKKIAVDITNALKQDLDKDRLKLLESIEVKLNEWFINEYNSTREIEVSVVGDTMCIPDYCCPKRKYGNDCKDCDLCSPHGGFCEGGGTKIGTGKCICNNGYTGSQCDACNLQTHFKSSQKNDFIVCSPCFQGCKSGCNGKTSDDCVDCADGFEKTSKVNGNLVSCVDMDECALDSRICPATNSYCLNTEGSFQCKRCDIACYGCSKSGPNGCASCAVGYEWVGDRCVDVDECELETMCPGNGEKCVNKPGTYTCVCQSGYDRFGDKCVKKPPRPGQKNNRKKSKNKIIWTVPFFVEFCKMIGSLCALGLFSYIIKGRPVFVILASSITCYYIFHKSIRLDTVYNAQK